MEQIGTVFVDAGIVLVGDPCYTLPDDASERSEVAKNWSEFCKQTFAPGPHQKGRTDGQAVEPFGKGIGIVVATGWGDGEYPVFAEYEDGRIARILVEFIPEQYEDDDDPEQYDEDDEDE